MPEQKELTVAEILARAQKENPELGTRRRRRRSLEDGGVSVAELTGSIKKVEAKPAESRHSSVPIDAPAKPAEPAEPAAPKNEPKAEQPEVKKAELKQPEPKRVKRASEDETAVIKKVSDAPAAPAPKAEAPKTEAPKPAPIVDLDAAPTKVEELEELDEFEGAEDLEGAEDTEEAGVNPITLVLMVFLGVVLGILGFMLFKWLWTSTPTAVAAILGVITVAGSVYAARAIGTGRDWLSVGLAGVAAVVIAFGPALL